MINKIRKWLGIEKDKSDSDERFKILCKAIDETLNLKKSDKSIQGCMVRIISKDFEKRRK